MSVPTTSETGRMWPADVIHVNEDGWVLVNRGRNHGVTPGLRLLVVGTGIRELRDLFSGGEGMAAQPQPQLVALRIRRTYEQLEVVYVEDTSAIAVATRTPPGRRPSFYRGPDGELLVWVPLPEGFTYSHPGAPASPTPAVDDGSGTSQYDASDDTEAEAADDGGDGELTDAPPEQGEQDDERWEEALPLNGVAVGDLVVPAVPTGIAPSATAIAGAAVPAPSTGDVPANPFESGRNYDWMTPRQ
jgi:hypothetical protein